MLRLIEWAGRKGIRLVIDESFADFADEPEKADLIQAFLGTAAYTEMLAYPVTAKYHLQEIAGLPLNAISSRSRSQYELTEYQKSSIRQMHLLASEFEKALKL